MNEQAAKLARRASRTAGTLVKRGVVRPVPQPNGPPVLTPSKLARSVKHSYQALSHKERGERTKVWRVILGEK